MPVHAIRGRPPGRPPPADNVYALPKRVHPVSHGSNQSNQPSDELTHATSTQENLTELLLTGAEKGRASTSVRPTAPGPDEVAASSLPGESPPRPTRQPDAPRNPPPSPPGSAGTAVSANAASGKARDNARGPSTTLGAGQSPHRASRVVPWPPTPKGSATSPAASLGSTASSPAAVQTGTMAVGGDRPPPPTAPPQTLSSGAHPPVTTPGPANLSDRLPDQTTAHEAFPALRSSDQTQTLPACNPAPPNRQPQARSVQIGTCSSETATAAPPQNSHHSVAHLVRRRPPGAAPNKGGKPRQTTTPAGHNANLQSVRDASSDHSNRHQPGTTTAAPASSLPPTPRDLSQSVGTQGQSAHAGTQARQTADSAGQSVHPQSARGVSDERPSRCQPGTTTAAPASSALPTLRDLSQGVSTRGQSAGAPPRQAKQTADSADRSAPRPTVRNATDGRSNPRQPGTATAAPAQEAVPTPEESSLRVGACDQTAGASSAATRQRQPAAPDGPKEPASIVAADQGRGNTRNPPGPATSTPPPGDVPERGDLLSNPSTNGPSALGHHLNAASW